MLPIRISALADEDLANIQFELRLHSQKTADHYKTQFVKAFRLLAKYPHAGHTRPDLPDDRTRAWVVWPYVILHETRNDCVAVLRVVHGKRDMTDILEEP